MTFSDRPFGRLDRAPTYQGREGETMRDLVLVVVACVLVACGGRVDSRAWEGGEQDAPSFAGSSGEAGAAGGALEGEAGAAGEAGTPGGAGAAGGPAPEPCPPLSREYAEGAVLVSTPGEPTALRVEGPAILEAASLGGVCYRLREAANIDGTIRSVLWPE